MIVKAKFLHFATLAMSIIIKGVTIFTKGSPIGSIAEPFRDFRRLVRIFTNFRNYLGSNLSTNINTALSHYHWSPDHATETLATWLSGIRTEITVVDISARC